MQLLALHSSIHQVPDSIVQMMVTLVSQVPSAIPVKVRPDSCSWTMFITPNKTSEGTWLFGQVPRPDQVHFTNQLLPFH